MYTGEKLEIVGKFDVNFKYKGQQEWLTLLVVPGEGPSLLGNTEDTLIDSGEINHLQAPVDLEHLLQRQAAVLNDELGTLKGMTVSLHVDLERHGQDSSNQGQYHLYLS